MKHALIDSPLGPVTAVDDDGLLAGLYLDGQRYRPAAYGDRDDTVQPQLREELSAYFSGHLQAFTVALAERGTPFQREVWSALRRIPYGETWSYATLAAEVGRPAAVRAVGSANGRNPVCLVVPCHRVIGADGSLTGYAGGVERKQWLLAHEAAIREVAAEQPLVREVAPR